jgi:hypothetical protein
MATDPRRTPGARRRPVLAEPRGVRTPLTVRRMVGARRARASDGDGQDDTGQVLFGIDRFGLQVQRVGVEGPDPRARCERRRDARQLPCHPRRDDASAGADDGDARRDRGPLGRRPSAARDQPCPFTRGHATSRRSSGLPTASGRSGTGSNTRTGWPPAPSPVRLGRRSLEQAPRTGPPSELSYVAASRSTRWFGSRRTLGNASTAATVRKSQLAPSHSVPETPSTDTIQPSITKPIGNRTMEPNQS